MYKVKWYQENGLYLAMGSSSANSLFFETKEDHELFLRLWNRFMGNMADIVHYSFTQTSWAIVFKTKSKSEIIRSYAEFRAQSKKTKENCTLTSVGPIISAHFRYLLSNYVPISNRALGKNGSRVKCRFQKYAFWAHEDYRKVLSKLENLYKFGGQKMAKYRPNEDHYDEKVEMELDSVNKCSNRYYRDIKADHFCLRNFKRIGNNETVLRHLILKTKNRHIKPNNPPPKQE